VCQTAGVLGGCREEATAVAAVQHERMAASLLHTPAEAPAISSSKATAVKIGFIVERDLQKQTCSRIVSCWSASSTQHTEHTKGRRHGLT
jgi:hypothetical protein